MQSQSDLTRKVLDRLVATVWASIKAIVATVTGPAWSVLIAWRASVNHRRATQLAAGYASRLAALARGDVPAGNASRRLVAPAEIDAFITSDLHRSIAGPLDAATRLDTRGLYEAALSHYADRRWHLIENGDVEDFWVAGGTVAGVAYDVARTISAAVPGKLGTRVARRVRARHLGRIVADNSGLYSLLRERFARPGRYWRTIGNHDEVMADPDLARHLRSHLPGVTPTDHLVLVDRAGRTRAIVTHGHHTDGWNAPGRSTLGRLATWAANTLADLPWLDTPEGFASPEESAAVLQGRSRNQLVSVNPRFGANRHYDSLDEELLFAALGDAVDDPNGPWLLFGHTHFPMHQPRSRSGRTWQRYANSGTALFWGVLTGLEWIGSRADDDDSTPDSEPQVRLVAWHWADDTTPPERVVSCWNGRRVARTVLLPRPESGLDDTSPDQPRPV